MSDKEIKMLCKGCGKAFLAFLREMDEHNSKVVCPNCGKARDSSEAREVVKGRPPTTG
jgi:DNA-directed RNA polymerase subunit RPC12/RpoP